MIKSKVTVGFVVQKFDTEKGEFIEQEFIAGDIVSWENEEGEITDDEDRYLPFDMKQP